MKKFRIKYQKGNNIELTEIEAKDEKEAQYIFYMGYSYSDILTMEEVKGGE